MTLKEIAPIIDLDLEHGVSLFMGREEFYLKYLKKFPESIRGLLIELDEALKEKDDIKIEAAAHSIKGVAGNLGVREVAALGSSLILDIRERTYENIEEHYNELVKHINKAITYIENLD